MRRFNPSFAALAIACFALFTALGGTSLAASLLIGTKQIKNGAVTSSKIGADQVRNRNLAPAAVKSGTLADNSVTSSKLADGSVTSADVAPNTFLPANGTADNSSQLGGHPSGDFLLGRGGMFVNRVSIPAGQTQLLISLGFGELIGKCAAGGVPQVEYQSDVDSVNLVDSVTDYGSPAGTASIHTTNGLTRGGLYIETHNTVVPQAITWQAAYDNGTPHVATAWTTGQDIGGSSCIFIAQGLASN
ncbi:MAG TPA: hypothetical protein VIM18_01800 [Solirubrobacteraceae bacterium]|jgi:hypothetical protein